MEEMEKTTALIIKFLKDIGIETKLESIAEKTFLPGLKLSGGALIIDTDKLLYPGDILHEAGHLACMPEQVRETMSDNLPSNDLHAGGEIMAIGWSYAACIYIGIAPEVVFHQDGYRDGATSLLENFRASRYLGVPLLQWTGMTYDDENAKKHGTEPYPFMQKWLCAERPQ